MEFEERGMHTSLKKKSACWLLCLAALMSLLTGCAFHGMQLPETLPEPEKMAATPGHAQEDTQVAKQDVIEKLDTLVALGANKSPEDASQELDLPSGKLTLNADALPLNRFIHMALGDVLKLSFDVDEAVASRTDPVTLHISSAVSARRLLGMVEETLDMFDVALARVDHGLRVLPRAKLREMPAVIRTKRAVLRQGQVIEVIPLIYAKMSELQALSSSLFQLGKYGRVFFNQRLNAVVVIGDSDRIDRFREFIAFLDRPGLKNHYLRLVRPIYWSADELVVALAKILKVQGIPVADRDGNTAAMTLLAIKPINAMLVASPQKQWMSLAESLIARLDGPDAAGPGQRTFIYFSRHRNADELGQLISKALGGQMDVGRKKPVLKETNAGLSPEKQTAGDAGDAVTSQQQGGLNVVVDRKRNAIVFVGTSSAYQKVVPILDRLDIPPRQVLIEVTIADVSLDETNQLGVEWQFVNVDNSTNLAGTLGTIGGLGVGAAGLSYTLANTLGNVRAKINALANKGKAKILSSPTLLAMDGETAHMQVGTQISVLTQEIGSVAGSTGTQTSLLRSFKYIDTGVILDISPTITDYGTIRMKLKQEVSEPGAGGGDSPPISKRIVDTVLVAETGQTVLLGGLMTHNEALNRTQVPLLGDIPWLGALFRNETKSDRSTELIILITPHIIRNKEDAAYLTNAYRKRLGW